MALQLGRDDVSIGYSTAAATIPVPHSQSQPIDVVVPTTKKANTRNQHPLTLLVTEAGRRTRKVKLHLQELSFV